MSRRKHNTNTRRGGFYRGDVHFTWLIPLAAFVGHVTCQTESIQFSVVPGTVLVRTVRLTTDYVLTSESTTINGKDQRETPGLFIGLKEHTEEVDIIRDVFQSIDDQSPHVSRRTFQSLNWRIESELDGKKWGEAERTSPLDGRTVVFSNSNEKGGLDVAFANNPEEDKSLLLSGLEEDMDLRSLLPTKRISKGDTWHVDVARDLLNPAGDLHFDRIQGTTSGQKVDYDRREGYSHVEVTYTGIMEREQRLAILGVHMRGGQSLKSSSALSERTYEVDGQLLWDLDNGHARSLSLKGRAYLTESNTEGKQIDTEWSSGEIAYEMQIDRG